MLKTAAKQFHSWPWNALLSPTDDARVPAIPLKIKQELAEKYCRFMRADYELGYLTTDAVVFERFLLRRLSQLRSRLLSLSTCLVPAAHPAADPLGRYNTPMGRDRLVDNGRRELVLQAIVDISRLRIRATATIQRMVSALPSPEFQRALDPLFQVLSLFARLYCL